MKIILKFLTFLALALQPIQNELYALLFFLAADAITGVWRAIKHKNFNSRKLAQTVGKFVLYFLAILVAQLADLYFSLPKIKNVTAAGLALIEIVSIMENIGAITGVNLFNKVAEIFKRTKTS